MGKRLILGNANRSSRRLWLAMLLFFAPTISRAQNASYRLERLREDSTLPENCAQPRLEDFNSPEISSLTVSIGGALAHGFSREHRLTRQEATQLWQLAKGGECQRHLAHLSAEAERDLELLRAQGPKMGFKFGSEGDVLELLSIEDLRAEFPAEKYFITGGLAYAARAGTPTLGELDIIIARRSDCKVVAIGESKLGVGSLGKAKAQLERFHEFLEDQGLHPRFSELVDAKN